jgi:hypothetical protein
VARLHGDLPPAAPPGGEGGPGPIGGAAAADALRSGAAPAPAPAPRPPDKCPGCNRPNPGSHAPGCPFGTTLSHHSYGIAPRGTRLPTVASEVAYQICAEWSHGATLSQITRRWHLSTGEVSTIITRGMPDVAPAIEVDPATAALLVGRIRRAARGGR